MNRVCAAVLFSLISAGVLAADASTIFDWEKFTGATVTTNADGSHTFTLPSAGSTFCGWEFSEAQDFSGADYLVAVFTNEFSFMEIRMYIEDSDGNGYSTWPSDSQSYLYYDLDVMKESYATVYLDPSKIKKLGFYTNGDGTSDVSVTVTDMYFEDFEDFVFDNNFLYNSYGSNTITLNSDGSFESAMTAYGSIAWKYDPTIDLSAYKTLNIEFTEVPTSQMALRVFNSDENESTCYNYEGLQNDDMLKSGKTFTVKIEDLTYTGGSVDPTAIAKIQLWNAWDTQTFKVKRFYLEKKDPVTVSVGTAGLATYCPTSNLDFSDAKEIAAYMASINGTTVTLTKVTSVAAGEGVLIRSLEGGEASESIPVTSSLSKAEDNAFVGVTEDYTISTNPDDTYTYYILSSVDGVVNFYKAADNTTVGAGKAYLPVETSVAAKGLTFAYADVTNEATAIGSVAAASATTSDVYYNLSGQRVSRPTKGVYITNGKKVIFK